LRLAFAVQLAFLCGLDVPSLEPCTTAGVAAEHGVTLSVWPRAMNTCVLRTTWPPISQVIVYGSGEPVVTVDVV
jgi:hypothetical protein